ncbi:MAG: FAD-dependent monooxygenase [Blastocatellia bacterium]
MKINIIGGGPAGLYFAILMKKQDAANDITIFERDGPNDTFGWGIVFSGQTFSYLSENDAESHQSITTDCQTWDNVDIVHRGQKVTIHGNKFSGIARLKFLNILQQRCRDLGVKIEFRVNVVSPRDVQDCDLLVGADGANSIVRRDYTDHFQQSVELRQNKYIWLGTHQLFHGLTLTFRKTDAGLFIAHSYKFSPTTSTFIVECSQRAWESAGFAAMSEAQTCGYLETVFSDDLGGNALLTNDFVRWLNFPLVKNARWHYENTVLLGDALHTAHFSIGSGTKLAVEDSISLSNCFKESANVQSALKRFEDVRKPVIDKYQQAAESSLVMFENAEEMIDLDPIPFAFKMMTRSSRIDYEKLKKRDPQFIEAYEAWLRTAGEESTSFPKT